ncbi:hypothetical protein NP590_02095 [Methylomonas sp. SURF-2]|uniref:Uncharacterized protein n=1 Tax=Methylomonas subterranea TaxID=2952225 RepID=A0ABT1TBQ7_9GAMM|nr:hypothetical protein [Methylomonas sp. SURF-2]MCQ8102883.1 hypothetical protein [Methylomonas sp. SURF-2]
MDYDATELTALSGCGNTPFVFLLKNKVLQIGVRDFTRSLSG